jgi:hypothetical protein
MEGLANNPSVFTEQNIDVFANHAMAPGGLRSQLEHFRAFPILEFLKTRYIVSASLRYLDSFNIHIGTYV